MRVLVIGGGGREHALVWKISQSQKVTDIYCAPGNAGTAEIAKNVPLGMDGVEDGNTGYTTKLSLSKHHAGIFDPKSYEINDKSSNPREYLRD